MKLLLEYGIDPDIVDADGRTPLDVAREDGPETDAIFKEGKSGSFGPFKSISSIREPAWNLLLYAAILVDQI